MNNEAARPGVWQYIAYSYGKILPASQQSWVRNDLAGKGAQRRTLARVTIPALLVIAPLWLVPTTLPVHLSMTGLLLLPFIYFTYALDKVWRIHRLRQHGLNPGIVDELAHKRDAHRIETYKLTYRSAERLTVQAS